MIDIEIVLQNLAKKWKTDLLKSFRCPVMMLGYKAILCSDENTFGISVKKYKMMKNYLQTSTTSTLLVTAVPAMTTTAASAGVYFSSSYFLSHFLISCHIFLFFVTFSYFMSHFLILCLIFIFYVTFSYFMSHFLILCYIFLFYVTFVLKPIR